MVAEALTFERDVDPAIAPARTRPLAAARDECLPYDPVLDAGAVGFKVAECVDLRDFHTFVRWLYVFFVRRLPRLYRRTARHVRRAPEELPSEWRVPPAPKGDCAFFTEDRWREAVCRCTTARHQIAVMPVNREGWPDGPAVFTERVCRPRDPAPEQQRMYRLMAERYDVRTVAAPVPPEPLNRIQADVLSLGKRVASTERRLRALEEERRCARSAAGGLTDGGG